MNDRTEPARSTSSSTRHRSRDTRIAVITVVAAGAVVVAVLLFAATRPKATKTPTVRVSTMAPKATYPIGDVDDSEPSGMAPPGINALSGYTQSYVSDFTATSLPPGWDAFTGVPVGDPGGQFGSAHDVVNDGVLRLNTWRDPAYHDEWVTGGVCQCGLGETYGAYFVRSRVTGAGPTQVELLWPATNLAPPDIEFNGTGGTTRSTSSAVHIGSTNHQYQTTLDIDMTRWHTWSVIWTPTSVTFAVDGRVWGTATGVSRIPDQAMTLDLEQQTSCISRVGPACPSVRESMEVDWVAEYTPK